MMFKIKHPRPRHTFNYIAGFFVILLYLITDPKAHIIQNLPFGANTIVLILTLLKAVWYIALLDIARTTMLDFLNFEKMYEKAQMTPEGAGYSLIATAIIMVAISIAIAAAVLSN